MLVKLKDGRYLKKDIDISTVVYKNDTTAVFTNSMEEWITFELTLLHNSRVIIGINDDGCVKRSLQNKNNTLCLTNHQVSIKKLGDIKWMCMLLKMEDMTSHWCIYCQLSMKEWKHCDRNRGEACTIDYINSIIEPNYINHTTKSNPTYQGVKVTIFVHFIPISHCLSLLHIWVGSFNDIDLWFVRSVGDIVVASIEEQEIKNQIANLDCCINAKISTIKEFDQSTEGIERVRLIIEG
jgi:hypothetical protein